MTDVWIVDRGEYSGYEVLAVFAEESVAREFVERHNELIGPHAYEADCHPMPLRSEVPQRVLWYRSNGQDAHSEHLLWDCEAPPSIHARRTLEEALKAAQDAIARARAEQEGLTSP